MPAAFATPTRGYATLVTLLGAILKATRYLNLAIAFLVEPTMMGYRQERALT